MRINRNPETFNNKQIDGDKNTLTNVSNTSLSDMAQATIKGRASGAGTGDPTDLTGAQASVIISGREFLLANRNVFVRADATGDSGRDGSADTTASAFLTWQAAIDWFDDNCFANGFRPIFRQGTTGVSFPHSYTDADPIITITGPPTGGDARTFVFSSGNDDDVRIETTTAGLSAVMLTGDFGRIDWSNKVRFKSAGVDFRNQGHGKCYLDDDATFLFHGTGTVHLQTNQEGAYISVDGTIKHEADVESPVRNDSGTIHINGDIELVGTRAFSVGYWRGDFFGQGYINGDNFTGSFTGPRCFLRDRSVLRYRGDVPIPGSTRGSCAPASALVQDGITENVMVGSATFVASTTVAVDFTTAGLIDQFDTNYMVEISGGNEARTYVVRPADRLTTGFTITASASNSDTVWWRLEWL